VNDIFERIQKSAPAGTVIPKPRAKGEFKVKGVGVRRGEPALLYTIPNHKRPERPYVKGVTVSEFERAFGQLRKEGRLTRAWFREHLPGCEADGSCNFTTVGGLFELIGEAGYVGSGEYVVQ